MKTNSHTPENPTFEQVILEFLRYSQQNKRSYKADLVRARALRKAFSGVYINDITKQNIQSYIKNRQSSSVSNSSINREIALLSAAINYCNNILDWQIPNKTTGLKLKEPQGRVRWISFKEANALIDAAKLSDKAFYLADFIIIALNTGCRSSELLQLTWNSINLEQSLILLEHTKSGKRRTIPINQQTQAALLNRLNYRNTHFPDAQRVFINQQGVGIDCVKKSFKSACERAGIENFRIHDMRHTCAAWLVMAGVELIVIRDLLGHSSVTVTEIYAHLSPKQVRVALEQLSDTEVY